ncbi:hypothetical protein E2C01_034389 [Portunus trituberculatus]|uniref:Uncharacterized protein n=1 Tax=Portunus trituberculatus TaxID=210409 RepID=A0A5B7F0I9_PORTR|nr:hypothetical protein [Portunus trituberculatus]
MASHRQDHNPTTPHKAYNTGHSEYANAVTPALHHTPGHHSTPALLQETFGKWQVVLISESQHLPASSPHITARRHIFDTTF